MPVYIKVGHEPRNKGLITSRAFFIKRIGTTIHRKWGAIKVAGIRVKKMQWEAGYPQKKDKKCKTIEEAVEFMRKIVARKIAKGYEKIPGTIK
jgi:hypothetical protein